MMKTMTVAQFCASLDQDDAPCGLPPLLLALWLEGKGSRPASGWAAAHKIVQEQPSQDAAWVHAYLHRREGDLSNARYWYARANRTAAETGLDAEWDTIVEALLAA